MKNMTEESFNARNKKHLNNGKTKNNNGHKNK